MQVLRTEGDVVSARLLLGLLVGAARWHAGMLPTRLSYWLRPYDSHLDARCWLWRRPPCRALVLDDAQLAARWAARQGARPTAADVAWLLEASARGDIPRRRM